MTMLLMRVAGGCLVSTTRAGDALFASRGDPEWEEDHNVREILGGWKTISLSNSEETTLLATLFPPLLLLLIFWNLFRMDFLIDFIGE